MYKTLLPLLAIVVVSCSTKIRYIGQSHSPTKDIEVFVSEQSIKRPYEYIGKGYLGGFSLRGNQNKIQKKAEKLGLEKGADAVLITDYYITNTGGTSISGIYRTDSIAGGTVMTGNTTVTPTVTSGFHILFIKYNKQD
ncbi:MAG: hypothetical protein H7Y01_03105 [Ferruginibacter sp.]|nr:hypothetical protein [Chitinophagaceae bacterium]